MDFEFSTEYEDFRKELRSFAEKDMPEGFDPDEADKDEIQAIRQKIAKKGWLTLPWPEEYGGMGAPHLKQMVFNEETAYRRIPANDNAISMLGPILMLEGTDEQKQKFLPPIAKAEVRWAQGYSCLLYTSPSPRDRG